MKEIIKWGYRILGILIVIATATIPVINAFYGIMPALISGILFVFFNIVPSIYNRSYRKKRHWICADGAELLIVFMLSMAFLIVGTVFVIEEAGQIFTNYKIGNTILTLVIIVLTLTIVFWNGIIRVYTTSTQLGIRYRVLGIILAWIFPVNLFMLGYIIFKTTDEVKSENSRILLNESRAPLQLCKTRYPILMVHGVFFRDFKQGFLNYWGRIPEELKINGATVYYGQQQSADSVAECGKELADRIRQIVAETGCGKVNVIAHSKGGLDTRYAISKCGVADMVASLTTINTPHRGCEFADYLLGKIPASVQNKVAAAYNTALRQLGDHDPDFLKAVNDLTYKACMERNAEVMDAPNVYYQSYGSRMRGASGGRFPLNYSYHLVKYFDGPNDGLVGEKSFAWGSKFEFLVPQTNRGISHGDMIDLNRENFKGFDVREFYVQLVRDLRERGF